LSIDYYYRILGLSKNASESAIKEAYRRKAKKFHPDINANPNANDIFIEITEAYQYLLEKEAKHRKLKDTLINNGSFDKKWEEDKRKKAQAYARRHAQMKYEQFQKSYMYKSAQIIINLYDYMIFFVGILCIFSSVFGVIFTIKADEFTAETVLAAFFGILIGIAFIIATFRKFRLK